MNNNSTKTTQVLSRMKAKKSTVHDVIPKKLNDAIESLSLSKIMTGKAIKLCCIIMRNCSFKKVSFITYIDIPAEYFEKTFNKEYHKGFLNQMKAAGIIQCIESYVKGTVGKQGKCKQYRINPDLMVGDNVPVIYMEKPMSIEEYGRASEDVIVTGVEQSSHFEKLYESKNDEFSERLSERSPISSNTSISTSLISSTSLSSPSLYHICPRFFDSSLVTEDLAGLIFNEEKMKEANEKYVKELNKRVAYDEEIQSTYLPKLRNNLIRSTYAVSKKSAIRWAKDNDANVIQFGSSYYIDIRRNFVRERRRTIRTSFEGMLAKLKYNSFFVSRNKTNRRLDHNLTTIGKHILNVIMEDNELVEIDIRNSQFAIHAFMMKYTGWFQHDDVQQYYDMCSRGYLYDDLATELGISRSKAKELMMEMAFSRVGNNSAVKKIFKQNFPNVVRHVDDFKKENGYKKFSNELQQLESEMIIDNLYPTIKKQGLFCLTKHDSLIIKRHDEDRVVELITAYFNHLEFECVLKIEEREIAITNKIDSNPS